jgi:3',5'-cyclic AMP phosphodiesterase CpdA
MNRFTLAHLSDLHLPFEPRLGLRQRFSKRQLSAFSWRRRRHLHRPEILDALAADVRAAGVDHIVVTGDITNFSLPAEFRQAAAWLSALAPRGELSLVPGNHDALVPVLDADGRDHWAAWTRSDAGWPFVHRLGDLSLIGLDSALPTAPLLARGRLGAAQLERLEQVLVAERDAGRLRIVALHHPPAADAIGWRKALADQLALAAVLRRAGAELVLHGHARDARLDALPGPHEPIPCLCVPSSSALPSAWDQGARWHRLVLGGEDERQVEVEVRRWSNERHAFVGSARYRLCLPRAGVASSRAATATAGA